MLAELGTDENHERKKRAEQGLPIQKEREDGNDDFGMQDEDWDIYR